ncbi:DUF4878 domain-containing protein [Gordonia humi]|uniref:Low molecular weight antigen MTB12-like C-terminal domain-containing protein n=1 Tax=Gordonia humi TaxID=686429 RepID=A0A840F6Y1_9ACTN|nr:DUF4878 domain-containing protein [Gordonia humi]MBB4135297.1 hypothetical protein [Gordonia humi]
MTISPAWRRPLVGVVALAAGATIALTGCSSDDNDSSADASTSTTTSASTGADQSGADQSAELSNAQAQDILRKAVDPATPEADLDGIVEITNPGVKAALIGYAQGSSKAGYTPDIYTVKSVKADGEKATATVAVASPHAPAPVDMDFEYVQVDGTWKLSAAAVEALASQMTSHGR